MNRLFCLAAALTLAASTSAFANAHKEAPAMAASAPMAAAGSCATAAAEKKLAGAAKTSFMKKCEADASSARVRRQGGREEAGRRGQDELHQEVRGRRQGRVALRPMSACLAG